MAGSRLSTWYIVRPSFCRFDARWRLLPLQVSPMIDAQQVNERQALIETFLACYRPLVNYVRRRLRYHEAQGEIAPNELRVEDIVDSTFVETIARTAERPAQGGIYPWLRRLARRILRREIERARRHRRERSLEEPLRSRLTDEPEAGAPPLRLIDVLPDPSAPVPEQVAEQAEFQRALARMLGEVPETWREPFLLHMVDGYSLRRVAELEGVSVSEIRRRIKQARELLRARLAEEYEDIAGTPPSEGLFASVERAEASTEHEARLRERLTAHPPTS